MGPDDAFMAVPEEPSGGLVRPCDVALDHLWRGLRTVLQPRDQAQRNRKTGRRIHAIRWGAVAGDSFTGIDFKGCPCGQGVIQTASRQDILLL